MQSNTDVMKKYYSDEARKLIAERQNPWSPELQRDVEQKWTALLQDIEATAAGGVDPKSPAAQALVERQAKLVEAFTGGHALLRRDWANFRPISRTGLRK